jgi:hypothetical protein
MENRPSGAGFVSYWNRDKKGNPDDLTKVTLVRDGTEVSRYKDKDSNGYSVGENVFGAMGTDVPDLVTSTLNLTELNVQKQLDPHFLLSLSAGDVAKYLNNLVNLSLIDEVMSKADTDIRKNKADIIGAEGDKDLASRDLASLLWVDKAEKLLATYDKYATDHDAMCVKMSQLQTLLSERRTSASKQQKYRAILEVADVLVAKMVKTDKELENLEREGFGLKRLVVDYKVAKAGMKYQIVLEQSTQFLVAYSKYDTQEVALKGKFGELGGLIAEHKAITGKKVSSSMLDTATGLIEAYNKDVLEWSNVRTQRRDVSILVRDYRSEQESKRLSIIKLKEAEALMPEVCPACRRPM